MKGEVLDFKLQSSEGVITGEDGNRYSFVSLEWKTSEINPKNGVEVDFVIKENKATDIYAKAKAENNISNSIDEFVKSQNVFMKYYVGVLKNYAKFDGRASREEFWYFTLFSFLITILLSVVSAGTLGLLYYFAVFVPTLAVGVRRLHDTNRSGWWYLISLIPIIGFIVLIVFWAFDSDEEENRFGPNPKQNNN